MVSCLRFAAYAVHVISLSQQSQLSLSFSLSLLCLALSPAFSLSFLFSIVILSLVNISTVHQPACRDTVLPGTNVFATSIEPDVSMIVDRNAKSVRPNVVPSRPCPFPQLIVPGASTSRKCSIINIGNVTASRFSRLTQGASLSLVEFSWHSFCPAVVLCAPSTYLAIFVFDQSSVILTVISIKSMNSL